MSNEPNAQPAPERDLASPADGAAFEAELARARDELLRALAEVENTRRRADKQAHEARAYAIDRFARELLPVADTLTRALAAVSPQARESADEGTRNLLAGIELTERALLDAFSRNGLRRVGTKGEAFDPNLHQAVAQAPSELAAGTVLDVMQAGYVLVDRTLRPAMVSVSAGPVGGKPNVDVKV